MTQPDWTYVKKTTLWPYEDLLQKLDVVLRYPVLRQVYNHSMPQAADFARRLFPDKELEAGESPAEMIAAFERLHTAGIRDWADLLVKVATREQCEAFVAGGALDFEHLIQVLNYLLRWGFPFYTATRELCDPENRQEMDAYITLKQQKLMCSFDLLEQGRTAEMRHELAQQTGLSLDFVSALVQRADLARLPYVRRKTILPLCGAGYDTLARIAAAELGQMEADMEAYFRARGKDWADYKSVIVLRLMVAWARALPSIII